MLRAESQVRVAQEAIGNETERVRTTQAQFEHGTVAKLDVMVCNLASPEDAKRKADAGLGWIGSTTGASQAHGSTVIVAADRHKADPNGKTINQLFKLAPN